MQSLTVNHILRSEKAAILSLFPHIKYIFASAGLPKEHKRQLSRQPLAPGEGSETRLNLGRPGKGKCTLTCSAMPD